MEQVVYPAFLWIRAFEVRALCCDGLYCCLRARTVGGCARSEARSSARTCCEMLLQLRCNLQIHGCYVGVLHRKQSS